MKINILAAILLTSITMLSCCGGTQMEVTKVEDMTIEAFVMSQDFCSKRLNTPSTADFPIDTEDSKIQYLGDSIFVVSSYVDSQDLFGAMLRTNYGCKLKYVGNNQWQLLDFELVEN